MYDSLTMPLLSVNTAAQSCSLTDYRGSGVDRCIIQLTQEAMAVDSMSKIGQAMLLKIRLLLEFVSPIPQEKTAVVIDTSLWAFRIPRFAPPIILCTDSAVCTGRLVALHLCHKLEDFSFGTI